MPSPVVVVAYDPAWPAVFERLARPVRTALEGFPHTVEHVGSTSVPGLAAKPIIDIDVVVPSLEPLPDLAARLARLGYIHQGDLGITGRESFRPPPGLPRHRLYVCARGSRPLRNHLALRDLLRARPDAARRYGDLKLRLAREFPGDIDGYIRGKTALVLALLKEAGLADEDLRAIGAEVAASTEPAGGTGSPR